MLLANPILIVVEDCDGFGGDNAVYLYKELRSVYCSVMLLEGYSSLDSKHPIIYYFEIP